MKKQNLGIFGVRKAKFGKILGLKMQIWENLVPKATNVEVRKPNLVKFSGQKPKFSNFWGKKIKSGNTWVENPKCGKTRGQKNPNFGNFGMKTQNLGNLRHQKIKFGLKNPKIWKI